MHSHAALNLLNVMQLKKQGLKVVIHVDMPKAAPKKVHLSFSNTRDDIEMK